MLTSPASPAPEQPDASRSKIWRISSAESKDNRPKNQARSAPAWPMRCDAAGRGRSPPSVFPLNLDPVLQDRAKRDPKPGPALYALRALALALAEQPNAAARLIGGRAIRSESIDIGVAVEAGEGIMVPVIRRRRQDFAGRPNESLRRAGRAGAQTPPNKSEKTSGGIASVSNFGTFGLDWGTPIPLPDQTLLLGLGAGKKGADLERREAAIRSDNAGRTDLEFRSSQPRRRRRRTFAQARRRNC